jgi:hypothetical protein
MMGACLKSPCRYLDAGTAIKLIKSLDNTLKANKARTGFAGMRFVGPDHALRP